MSFVSEFNLCFKKGLQPYGFKKLKGCNIYGKIVNDEILYYITFQKRNSLKNGNFAFSIKTGIQTIYSYELSKHQLELCSINLFNYKEFDKSLKNRPTGWDIFEYNDTNVKEILNISLKETISVALKHMSIVVDLKSYIEYLKKVRIDLLKFADKIYRDSVILIISDNHDTFTDVIDNQISSLLPIFNNDNNNLAFIENIEKIKKSIFNDIVAAREKVYDSPDLMNKVLKEIELRKNNNIESLKKYGLL
jgi:hypothetical protein